MAVLSRREREIMDALHALGESDVEGVRTRLADAPGYDSVRTILRILTEKGQVKRKRAGRKDIYRPAQPRAAALKNAWSNLVQTFFGGSYEDAAATLLRASDPQVSERKLAALLAEIERNNAVEE
ncbi:MAG: BlaI/MecI/CopY family transcriptional regulator [Hyphomonadaceae bacterium]